ncbi:glutamyl-tRNA reductase [Corynebacterium ulcerans]|uniref:glutamyl-tRNA reductase n=1 Tax=Corynebacterium ulcerans TaxID=65058 RepID=UPI0006284290|nr:glutamyl-tRNA reductase [Corynebacterium ulcerans]KKO86462.1 glutamyl-tRNA reductase [Corynebacterium ulcerans]KKO87877.1 glutamyl-tRNA reductase [Corynebacterium ulcerans]KPJ25053.1 glutamyl-tRNA reductase [Corynebacterium ulcerans]BDV25104.1 glutamyl-tRNA reductase [Corynebacterium ulcerans]
MSVLVVGMSHRSAPVTLLERLSMNDEVRSQTATDLIARPSLTEAMIVSTCNRLEVYAMTSSFHTGVNDVVEVLHTMSGVDMDTLRGYLYVRYADAAAEHMMVVASGMDSMVMGEQQIIGQVRTAYQQAIESGTVGPALHGLVQASLHTGKRVHTETDIDDAGASMVSFAFDRAMSDAGLSDLRGKKALVLGAGAMASLAATHLGRLGIEGLVFSNRTRSRAERLAEHSREAGVPAEVVDFASRGSALSGVHIAISATGAHTYTISAQDVPEKHLGLIFVDLSMPRDINDDVADIEGVQLVNIEKLHEAKTESNDADDAAHKIVAEELSAYTSAQRVRDVAPAVSALRRHASGLIASELERLHARTPGMDEEDFEEVQRTIRRVVDKLLHQPTVRVKELAASSGAVSYETALQDLFGLPVEAQSVKRGVRDLPDADVMALGVSDANKIIRAIKED